MTNPQDLVEYTVPTLLTTSFFRTLDSEPSVKLSLDPKLRYFFIGRNGDLPRLGPILILGPEVISSMKGSSGMRTPSSVVLDFNVNLPLFIFILPLTSWLIKGGK
jgi:hypothetical protein